MLMILAVVIVLFGGLYFLVDYKNKQTVESSGNPYGKEKLHQETIDQLDDPLYQNHITPDELENKLDDKEDLTVYYYSPICVYFKKTTTILVPLEDTLGVDLHMLSLYE